MDRVSAENVGRCGFDMEDVGLPKVRAVHRRLLRIHPHVEVEEHDGDFLAIQEAAVAKAFASADLIVMGTDAQAVQLRGNEVGYRLGKPMLFPGFYPRAEGGEIVVVIPPGPCYRCQVPGRFDQDDKSPGRQHDLVAEPGLVFDCDHLDSIAGKLAVAILAGEDSMHLGAYVRHVRQNGLILSKHTPDMLVAGQDLFSLTHPDRDTAFAYQTAWLDQSSARNPACPVCGQGAPPPDSHK